MTIRGRGALFAAIPAAALLIMAEAAAEPWLATFEGLHCSSCHSHPGGGGQRTAYGNVYAQTELAATRLGAADAGFWTGAVTEWLSTGANLRSRYEYVDVPNREESSAFDVTRGTVYLRASLIPDRLAVYVDQQIAPSAGINREAYVFLKSAGGRFHLTAGQFYLPYGLRLQDDTAFVRQVTGINFTTPDRGVQIGYESGPWSALLSATNGTGGGEIDTGKQGSLLVSYVRPGWRAGASINVNDADAGDRQMQNVFAGLRTGPVAWLAEVDWIREELPDGADRDAVAGLIEGNWLFAKGQNLKIAYEYFDPDTGLDEDHEVRWSVVWEYFPFQFLQGRVGLRSYDGIPQDDVRNRDLAFIELHGYF